MASPEPTDEQLTRIVLRVLAAFVAVTFAGGVASAAGRLAEGEGEGNPSLAVGRGLSSPRGGVGPLPGTAVPAYVRARVLALQRIGAAEGRTAVVSFDGYRAPGAALEAVAGLQARSLLVALPGGRSVVTPVDVDVADLVADQRREAAAEKQALEELLPTVTDEDFKRQYQADIDRLAALLAAPSEPGPVVHAVVVTGTGDALRRVARRPGVRLVDPAVDDEVPGAGAASGLRPEEKDRAGEPPTRPTS